MGYSLCISGVLPTKRPYNNKSIRKRVRNGMDACGALGFVISVSYDFGKVTAGKILALKLVNCYTAPDEV